MSRTTSRWRVNELSTPCHVGDVVIVLLAPADLISSADLHHFLAASYDYTLLWVYAK